jgi:ssDNA-binding Zn-finger/Zn-ribbon topoisomerase 1
MIEESPMRIPGRSRRAIRGQACPRCGYETYDSVSGLRRCPECGTDLEESPSLSFKEKVKSSVPEPSQRLMDEILEDSE